MYIKSDGVGERANLYNHLYRVSIAIKQSFLFDLFERSDERFIKILNEFKIILK